MKRFSLVLLLALAMGCGSSAHAADRAADPMKQKDQGCTAFTWTLQDEFAWVTAADSVSLQVGDEIPAPPAKGITLSLKPTESVKMPVPTGMDTSKLQPKSFSGWFKLSNMPKEGVYQVSATQPVFVDFVQDGKPVLSIAHSCARKCEVLQKSIRYQSATGPTFIQITGAKEKTIKITIHEAY